MTENEKYSKKNCIVCGKPLNDTTTTIRAKELGRDFEVHPECVKDFGYEPVTVTGKDLMNPDGFTIDLKIKQR